MAVGGVFLRFGSTALRAIEFGASAVALGIFSYFLSVLADRDTPIAKRWLAVEGMSGAACLYTIFGVVLTCCLGGITIFGLIAIILDILFVGAFIAIAILTRHGAGSCRGIVNTPLGIGNSETGSPGYNGDFGFGNGENATYQVNYHTACRLNTAVFAVSIINIFFFLITAAVQVALIKRHKADKKYGPSPSNNYTKGRGRFAFFKRNKATHSTRDAEAATALPHDHTIRPSHETGTTVGNNFATEPKYGQPGYGQATNY